MNVTKNYFNTTKKNQLHQHAILKSHVNFIIDSNGKIINKSTFSIQLVDVLLYLACFLALFIVSRPIEKGNFNTSKGPGQPYLSSVAGYLKLKAPLANPAYLKSIEKSAIDTSHELKIDKNLLLAVMSVESSFDQYAMSEKGAMCLMQIMPNFHAVLLKSKFKKLETRSIYDVDVCVHSGGKILATYIAEQKSVERGLLRYNGSINDKTKFYSNKVLAEKRIIDKLERA